MLLNVKLYPEVSNLTRENPPVASFALRVISSTGDRKALSHPGRQDLVCFNSLIMVSLCFCSKKDESEC